MSGDGADEVSLRACQGGMDAQRGQRQLENLTLSLGDSNSTVGISLFIIIYLRYLQF